METMEKIQLKSQQPAGLQGSRAKIYREQAQLGGRMVADEKTGLW